MLEDYNRQVTSLGITLDSYFIRCEQAETKLSDLQAKRLKEENIVRDLGNSKAEIRKVAEEKVRILLSDRRRLMKLAALCITESIRQNPEKYRHLISQGKFPDIDYSLQGFNQFWMYEKPPQQQPLYQFKVYSIEDYIAVLSEDADKLMEKIIKELGEELLNDHPTANRQAFLAFTPQK